MSIITTNNLFYIEQIVKDLSVKTESLGRLGFNNKCYNQSCDIIMDSIVLDMIDLGFNHQDTMHVMKSWNIGYRKQKAKHFNVEYISHQCR